MTGDKMMNDYLDKKFNEWFNNADIHIDDINAPGAGLEYARLAFIAGFEEANRLNW
jgi:hypothetical protein